jgi:hypothetical protein
VVKYLALKNQKGMFTEEKLRHINLPRILRGLQNMGIIKKKEQ